MFPAALIVFLACFSPTLGVPRLLFANRRDIRLVDAGREGGNATVLVSGLEDAAAVDFIYNTGAIYWTDVSQEMIRMTNLTDPHRATVDVITTGLVSPDGLACDWLGEKLYWTESETNRIEVSDLDGRHRKVLFWSDLDQPRAIALDPCNGYMYWTDWGEQPKIERAGMDGSPSSRRTIINSDVFWPNGLTIDYRESRLYFADAKKSFIHSCNLDGSDRKSVVGGKLPHPFALTMYGNTLFWTDWQTRSINACDKHTGAGLRQVSTDIYSPMDIHVYQTSRQSTDVKRNQGINPCAGDNGGCSHLCLMAPDPPFYSCACPTGVRLTDDNKTCAESARELLLLVRRTDLRRISLDTPDYTDVVLQLRNIQHAIAVDYDPVEGHVYWTDEEVQVISRAYLDGSGQESIVSSEVEHPDGVAVDWIARNIYWTDTGTDRVEVARLNGTARRVLVSEQLDEPRAIALDPVAGYMYWTDWGISPMIERAFLDGSNRTVLVNTSLGWPNGLALDFTEQKIYWGDAKTDNIEVMDMTGANRRTLVSEESNVPHIFGFSLLGEYIYWTDWQKRSIERVNKRTGGERRIIIEQLPDLMGLKAVSVERPQGTNPCAVNNGNCSHLCLYRPDGALCACPMGLELLADARTCIEPDAFLLFSRRSDIRRISIETSHNDVIIPLAGVKSANALDFDINDHRIYWTDIQLKSISRAFMNGSAHEHVVRYGLEYPEGMAVDWVAHNLYWADMGTRRIEMSRMDGTSRRVLIWREIEPRAIALDPPNGYMYWSNWHDNPRIERSALDGTHRTTLVKGGDRLQSLAIDFTEHRLYWTNLDSRIIESTDLNGADRQTVVHQLPRPFGLTQYLDYIYWTDWDTKSIEKANKSTGQNRTRIQDQLEYIVDVSVFHSSRQSGWNTCNGNNGGCSRLCVAHSEDYASNLTHHCECPTHYNLAPDNTSCQAPDSFLLYSQKSAISRLVDADLTPQIVLPIHGLRNIKSLTFDPIDQYIYWIDGRSKTIKRARDDGARLTTVLPQATGQQPHTIAIDPYTRRLYWSDQSQNVINVTRLDGRSVGVVLTSAPKPQNQQKPRHIALAPKRGYLFWTNLVKPSKIERASLDGTNHVTLFGIGLDSPSALTVDESVEKIFWADADMRRIESADFDGANRKVLKDSGVGQPVGLAVLGNFVYWVDRDHSVLQRMNKLSGRGEMTLHSRLSQLSDIWAVNPPSSADLPCRHDNGGCSHLCVHEGNEHRCSCPIGLQLAKDMHTCGDPPTCAPEEFACLSGGTHCIPSLWRCDDHPECEDQSDELDCPTCSPGQFRCHSGHCIPGKMRCDGRKDCDDDSDEALCSPCASGYMECSDKSCIESVLLCNNQNDCPDGEDERGCDSSSKEQVVPKRERSHTEQYTISVVVGFLIIVIVLFIVVFACRKKSHQMHDDVIMVASLNDSNPPTLTLTTSLGHPRAPSSVSSPPYDRNHVTGASSSSSSMTHYPQETLNPPPSPITDRSLCGAKTASTAAEDLYYVTKPSSRRQRTRRHVPPLPTPASTTDVCEDSEPLFRRHRPRRPPRTDYYPLQYDSEPLVPPPPPTPQNLYEDDDITDCPPSPSTERSFFNPYPPPPSPVAPLSDC